MVNHIERWQKDTDLLANLRTSWNDELDISSGRLELKIGNRKVSYPNILKQPIQIAEYLENLLKTSAEECFKNLQTSKNDLPEFYEKVALFQKQVKILFSLSSTFEYQLRNSNTKKYAPSYLKIFDQSYSLFERVKKYKSELRKPSQEERPIKHFEYNERTQLSSIKYYHPKRVPLNETVAAAKKALSLSPSTSRSQRILKTIGKVILLAIPIIALSIISVLKLVLWDAYASLLCGKVFTSSPLLDFLDRFIIENTDHWKAYQALCKQILRQSYITKDVVNAFKEVASHAETLDLLAIKLVTDDLMKFEDLIPEDERPGAIPVGIYLRSLKSVCERKKINITTLKLILSLYSSHNNTYLSSANYRGKSIDAFLEDRIGGCYHLINIAYEKKDNRPLIDVEVFKELVDIGFALPHCRKIKLSNDLNQLTVIRESFKSYSFKLKKKETLKNIYMR
jgi:hypothetical protein